MQTTKKLLVGAFFTLIVGMGFGKNANAQAYYYQDYYGGVAVGWGWYGPAIIVNYPLYGYTYYPYYRTPNYQTYAAISYSPTTKKYGMSWGQPSRYDAVEGATSYCNQKDCQPLVWVQGGCASMFSGDKGESLSWAYYSDRETAKYYARNACKRASVGANPAVACKERAWVCSF